MKSIEVKFTDENYNELERIAKRAGTSINDTVNNIISIFFRDEVFEAEDAEEVK